MQRRKGRSEAGAFLIEGVTQLEEALDAGAQVLEVFAGETDQGKGAARRCTDAGVTCHRVNRPVERTLAETSTSPGVVAVVRSPAIKLQQLSREADLVLVLAQVRDPGNAGTLIRSAAAAGAGAVIFSTQAVDPLGGKTVRSAAGAVFRVPLVLDLDLDAASTYLRARGFSIIGTDPRADIPPESCDMKGPVALVLGNEARGMPRESEDLIDEMVAIPMPGGGESLNVGVAGSILLFEAVRQRRSAA